MKSNENKYLLVDFVDEIAKKILDELSSDQSKEAVLTTIEEEYNLTNEFSSNILNLIEQALSGNEQLKKDFLGIYEADEANMINLLDSLFYYKNPQDDSDDIPSPNPTTGMSIEISSSQDDILVDNDQQEEGEEQNNHSDEYIAPEHNKLTIDQQIDLISKNLLISKNISYLLLKKFSWNEYRLIQQWIENKESIHDLLNDLHISELDDDLTLKKFSQGTCPICQTDDLDLYKLYCGHYMCEDCWKGEIEVQMEKIKTSISPIHCRFDNCNSEIMPDDISRLCKSELLTEYKKSIIENRATFDRRMIKCPSLNCLEYILIDSVGFGNIGVCSSCGKQICWECQREAHSPLKCFEVDEWKNLENYFSGLSSEQEKWVKHELESYEYRFNHIEEVQELHEVFNRQVEHEHEEIKRKEEEEIENLKKQLSTTEDETYKKFIEIMIDRKEIQHKNKTKEREELRKLLKADQKEYESGLRNEYLCIINANYIYFNKEVFNRKKLDELKSEREQAKREKQRRERERRQRIQEEKEKEKEKMVFKTSDEFVKVRTKPCPKCKSPILKNGGCNHMTCERCSHEFCWICGADWTNSHYNCIDEPEENTNTNNNNNENEHEIDKTYTISPLNTIILNDLQKYLLCKKNYDKYRDLNSNEDANSRKMRSIVYERLKEFIDSNELDQKYKQIFRSYYTARTVLMNGFAASYFLGKKTGSFNDYIENLKNLERIYMQFDKILYQMENLPSNDVLKISSATDKIINQTLNEFELF